VAPATLTAATEGRVVKVHVDENGAPGTFFGINQARLCRGGANFSFSSQMDPGDFGDCIAHPMVAGQDDDFVAAPTDSAHTSVDFTFRVGMGTQTFTLNDGTTQSTISCDADHPCALWLQESVASSVNINNEVLKHFDIQYAAAPTTTTLTSSANPVTVGHSVTFTATVAPIAPVTGTPTGNVTFKDGSATLATVPLSGGTATYSSSTLALGQHNITAVYGGAPDFTSSTSHIIQEFVSNTTTTVASSANPSVWGQPVMFTATVAPVPPAEGTPTGTVTFKDGTVTLGTATMASGQATLTTSALTVGKHTITATYNGGGSFIKSAGTLSQRVNKASTTTAVTSNVNPSVSGQVVAFTATVSPVAPSAATPTGAVTFKDGATSIGQRLLSGGQATLNIRLTTPGPHSITAVYVGSTADLTSTSPPLTQTVNQAATTTALSSSRNPSLFGQNVTFTAKVSTVAPASGTATGTITFKDGSTTLATVNAPAGTAAFTISTLAKGTHSITATYNGDANHLSSTSPGVSQTVN
jgi:hypothetical protein